MDKDAKEAARMDRRDVLTGVGVAAAAAALTTMRSAEAAAQVDQVDLAVRLRTQEYWTQKGNVKLYLYRKRLAGTAPGAAQPVLFLVHGSSISGRSSFDLATPGLGEYSLMNVFARYGYDVWTMDFEGYGRSTVTPGNSDIKSGVADLAAAAAVVARETGQRRMHLWGESSGGLRAAAFAAAYPDRAGRLVLGAFTYTGKGSPTLADRSKQLAFYRANNRRPRDINMIRSIFTRDRPGTSDPRVGDVLAAAELPHGDTVPTGTYLDMTANLPVVDPKKVQSPVLLLRGEYDGIATEEDLTDFFRQLPNPDRQFVILPGIAHSLQFAVNRALVWHAGQAFLSLPPAKTV